MGLRAALQSPGEGLRVALQSPGEGLGAALQSPGVLRTLQATKPCTVIEFLLFHC